MENTNPKLFAQEAFHDVIIGLDLSKEKAEVLGFRLKQCNLLEDGVHITTARYRHRQLSAFFKITNHLCYCEDAVSCNNSASLNHTKQRTGGCL